MMTLEEAVNALKHHDSYAVFLHNVHQLREETISELNKSSTQEVQQTSGKILAYDEILRIGNFEEVQKKPML